MPLYLSHPGGKMKGMSVLRTLGMRLAQPLVSKRRGGHQAGKHTAHSNRVFCHCTMLKSSKKTVLVGQWSSRFICQYDLGGSQYEPQLGLLKD